MGCNSSVPAATDAPSSRSKERKQRKPKCHPPFEPVVEDSSRRLLDRYEMGKRIGKGHYGLVYTGRNRRSGRLVAIKRIDRSMCTATRIQEEIEILRLAGRHKYVVELIDAFETDTHVELVMELMEGGELYSRIARKGPFSEVKAALVMRRLATAVQFLHKAGIVHRDLKPENLLLLSKKQEEVVKIADFGLAKLLENQTHMTTVCGTWAYSAPEVRILRRPYTNKVDIWSMGVIMFTILGGYHPFDPYGVCSEMELESNVKALNFDFDDEVWTRVSKDAKHLIRSMLQHDPKKRPSARRILLHPWIRKYAPRDVEVPGMVTRDTLASCKARIATPKARDDARKHKRTAEDEPGTSTGEDTTSDSTESGSESETDSSSDRRRKHRSKTPKTHAGKERRKHCDSSKDRKTERRSRKAAEKADKRAAKHAATEEAMREVATMTSFDDNPPARSPSASRRAVGGGAAGGGAGGKESWKRGAVATDGGGETTSRRRGRRSLRPSIREVDQYEPMIAQSPQRRRPPRQPAGGQPHWNPSVAVPYGSPMGSPPATGSRRATSPRRARPSTAGSPPRRGVAASLRGHHVPVRIQAPAMPTPEPDMDSTPPAYAASRRMGGRGVASPAHVHHQAVPYPQQQQQQQQQQQRALARQQHPPPHHRAGSTSPRGRAGGAAARPPYPVPAYRVMQAAAAPAPNARYAELDTDVDAGPAAYRSPRHGRGR